jgi:twinkle protein
MSSAAPGNGTFVSSYYKVDADDIKDLFKRKNLKFKSQGEHFVVCECPFCSPTAGKADNLWKLYLKKSDGAYFCHRCGQKGSWFDFKTKCGDPGKTGGRRQRNTPSVEFSGSQISDPKKVLPDQAVVSQYTINLMKDEKHASVLNYLMEVRGIKQNILEKYCVGVGEFDFPDPEAKGSSEKLWKKYTCVTFPWLSNVGVFKNADGTGPGGIRWEYTRVKARGVDHKSMQRLLPSGGGWGLFGWHTVPDEAKSIILTEGEYDAMAVHQATGVPSVSLPNGCRSLPVEVLPMLERFEKIYLWMDNDPAGQEGIEKFAKKLGTGRCLIVRTQLQDGSPGPKDANDALREGFDMRGFIEAAMPLPHKEILTFSELRQEIRQEIENPSQVAGHQYRTLPVVNRILKGFRPGELTVLTGSTGSGKTTLLSQMSVDLCQSGINTLWGSFEIKNTRLIKKMLTQLVGYELEGRPHEHFDAAASRFEDLALYFMRFYGSTEVESVLDAMEYAVYSYDVQHILLDNLQFMLGGQGMGRSNFGKFDAQENALEKFRQFATANNVHITLVIHPRKEDDDTLLHMSSIFGAAKATQEADNVMILQRMQEKKFLDIKKNRFDGTLGRVNLYFDERALIYRDDDTVLQNTPITLDLDNRNGVAEEVVGQELVVEGAVEEELVVDGGDRQAGFEEIIMD